MKLLTKIIGKAPSEMSPDELIDLIKRNRARIRKEIKEYRKLKNAIRETEGPAPKGRPRKIKEPKSKATAFEKELKDANLSVEQLNKILNYLKEKK